ncbi:MAG: hypothetical protein V7604_2958 [Hyphomicrobiales bacterium]
MAGLDPAIHVFAYSRLSKKGVDARNKSGHDEVGKINQLPTRIGNLTSICAMYP